MNTYRHTSYIRTYIHIYIHAFLTNNKNVLQIYGMYYLQTITYIPLMLCTTVIPKLMATWTRTEARTSSRCLKVTILGPKNTIRYNIFIIIIQNV